MQFLRVSVLWVKRTKNFLSKGRLPVVTRVSKFCKKANPGEMSAKNLPSWNQPQGHGELKLYNSLTREKNLFIPSNGRRVTWYSCGPTVYDASHMGHARSYITFDIVRRVLQSYFNYDVFCVMNVTDIDDKIIHRARRNHLQEKYREENSDPKKILSDIQVALQPYVKKMEDTKDEDKKNMFIKIIEKVQSTCGKLEALLQKGKADDVQAVTQELLADASDPLSAWLDSKHGSDVTDHRIFAKLTEFWEQEYHKDMAALNVLPADILTNITEYVPEVVTFIEKVIANGYAYESNGSVYFDTIKFGSSEKHSYARLVPEAVGDLDALAEGEGELSQNLGEKRSERDFALWKASKQGEPSWESPWGKGRPGWHVECSVMASDVLGSNIDIHTGGVDLKFPHHDNELAQSEAHFCVSQWVNYFLHAGHLTIEGCKMSKSLKNFITIKQALKRNSSRQIRLAFLLHTWNATLDYSQNVIREAEQVEKLFNGFFLAVKDILRKPEVKAPGSHNYHELEKDLQSKFHEKKDGVHQALCDSIDTPGALRHMQDLVKLSNIYISNKKQRNESANKQLLEGVAKYITQMLKIFGANEGVQLIGFGSAVQQSGGNQEEVALPYVQLLADFREDIRAIAREEKVPRILKACDDLRDNKLVDVGVLLEDQEGDQKAVIKFVDRETLLKERQQKLEEQAKKQRQKEEAKRKQEEEKAAKEAKARIPPWDMFKQEKDKYSAFDEQGIPTHDASGEPISGKQVKKLKKLYQQQEKLYNTVGPGASGTS
ncbi:cysteine--tRNA ligase, cytoplasmic-like isoform X2 [Nematostella vectensis]|uniref:cysteine--tRNA ligase, cytoplasmic-like isoform X2 n=1 Tax=Nematostella vectensis TaxID=45351 RepID=UPI00207753F3|nr:cysteine--tRNA ligase, cytoplasmic-like isoform X2 [Nematostella vectensis]